MEIINAFRNIQLIQLTDALKMRCNYEALGYLLKLSNGLCLPSHECLH